MKEASVKKTDALGELVRTLARLRAPGGCPWDRAQTHASMKGNLIEETYEVVEAIDSGDDAKLKEELGDLLLQVAFHCQMASEEGRFDLSDVAAGICEKLHRRHPHVFGDATAETPDAVLEQWHRLKRHERGQRKSVVDGVPHSLPALLRAFEVQKRVAKVGFDWEHAADVVKKVHEELGEIDEAAASGDAAALAEEVGDLLFSAVNLARAHGVEPEDALRQTVEKFIRRFQRIEARLAEGGRGPEECTLEELDALWNEVKAEER